ncbi:MAG TPA: NTP transferase domain-containing protein [Phycisphaerales bacterium]|nr:NTP transferase domain-containing protein [Phycisphaerales bacterium]
MTAPSSSPQAAPSAAPPRAAPGAIILAAGKGTRMSSDLPKVVHEVGGRPMVCAVVDACREAGCGKVVLVVGYKQELVRGALARAGVSDVEFAVQEEQHGTGHAVQCARGFFHAETAEPGHDVFVLAGDGPLIRGATLRRLLGAHRDAGAAATLATSVVEDPAGYGRIVRDAAGAFQQIVEHKDATPEQLLTREINPSYYVFDARELFSTLLQVTPNKLSGEYYVTDVPALLLRAGKTVEVIAAVPPEDVLSVNTPEQLAEVDRVYRGRAAAGPDKGALSGARAAPAGTGAA